MELHLHFLTLFFVYHTSFAHFDNCIINVGCTDCLPDHLPDVISHSPFNDHINIFHDEEATLTCHQSKFKSYPDKNTLKVTCNNGYFNVTVDSDFKHIGELGCQANYFEDIPHSLNICRNELNQERSFQYYNSEISKVEHLAELCYDIEKKRTIFARMTLSNFNDIKHEEHGDDRFRLSMLESFSRMYDTSNKAELDHVYFDSLTMDKKMKFLLGNKRFDFAEQALIVTKMLSPRFYHKQKGRVTNFSTNKMAMWKSVANGNFKNIQTDIINNFRVNESSNVDIFVGTHEILTLPTDSMPYKVFLKPNEQYPVPKFVYTIVHDRSQHKAVVTVTVNNPFITLNDIKDLILCTNVCDKISWLQSLKNNRNYERIIYGLTMCCDLHSFSRSVPDSPNLNSAVKIGMEGLLN